MTGVDASALKNLGKARGRLGTPPLDGNPQIDAVRQPQPEQAAPVPETAPSALEHSVCPLAANKVTRITDAVEPSRRFEGRTHRRSTRTLQLAAKVTPEYDDTLRFIAQEQGLLIVEVLEQSLAVYERLVAHANANGESPLEALERLLGGGPK